MLNQQDPALWNRTENAITGRQCVIGNALEVPSRAESTHVIDVVAMAAGYDLQAAVFFRGIYKRQPEVDHEGVGGIQLEISEILMPGDDGPILVWQLCPDVELRMREYLVSNDGFHDVEDVGVGDKLEHRG